MPDKNPLTKEGEKQRQDEAAAHRTPFGQTETVELDGAGDTHPALEKTKSCEPVETSLRGSEDVAPGASEGEAQP